MGDVAMLVPVVRALLHEQPELKITLVSRGFFAPFFAEFAQVQFLAVDLKDRHKGLSGLYRLMNDIRATGAEALADLHCVLRSRIVGGFARLAGMPVVTLDKGRAEKKALTRAENKVFVPLKKTTERYADVLRALGFSVDLSQPPFPEQARLDENVRAVTGNKTAKWIGVAPFAQHPGKVYPADLMREVLERLNNWGTVRVFLFGAGATEADQIEELRRDLPNVHSMVGRLPFAQELQLIANLDAMLSMDSGNAHIAAMYNVPTITLWGATHPYAGFAPFNQPEVNALTADRTQYPLLPTSIYGNKIVPGYEQAMRSISPAQIVERIQQVLN